MLLDPLGSLFLDLFRVRLSNSSGLRAPFIAPGGGQYHRRYEAITDLPHTSRPARENDLRILFFEKSVRLRGSRSNKRGVGQFDPPLGLQRERGEGEERIKDRGTVVRIFGEKVCTLCGGSDHSRRRVRVEFQWSSNSCFCETYFYAGTNSSSKVKY